MFFSASYLISLIFPSYWWALFTLFCSLVVTFISTFFVEKNRLASIAVTLFGLVWITIPLATLFQINYFFSPGSFQGGPLWLFYCVIVTKGCDTAAYFSGKLLGKHKIAPVISPNKTWEGTLGGVCISIALSVLFYFFTPISISLIEALVLGAFVGLLAFFGDLSESLIKRDVNQKDSNQLPGLGGILDVFDSLIFTAPLVYLFLLYKWGTFA